MDSKKKLLAQWLERTKPPVIDAAALAALQQLLAPISPAYLRRLLLASGWPLAPEVEGVVQRNLSELERTLLQLQQLYEAGDAARRKDLRALVVTSREHAQMALRREPTNATRAETLLWLREWLENPLAFALWVKLRKDVLRRDGLLHLDA